MHSFSHPANSFKLDALRKHVNIGLTSCRDTPSQRLHHYGHLANNVEYAEYVHLFKRLNKQVPLLSGKSGSALNTWFLRLT